MKLYKNLLSCWEGCVGGFLVWTVGLISKNSDLAGGGFIFAMASAIAVLFYTVKLFVIKYREAKEAFKDKEFPSKDFNVKSDKFDDLAERTVGLPVASLCAITVFAGCLIALNFFYVPKV